MFFSLQTRKPKTQDMESKVMWNTVYLAILHYLYLVNKCHLKYVILTMKDLDINLNPCRQLLGARRHSHHTGNIIVVRAH